MGTDGRGGFHVGQVQPEEPNASPGRSPEGGFFGTKLGWDRVSCHWIPGTVASPDKTGFPLGGVRGRRGAGGRGLLKQVRPKISVEFH